MAKQTKAGFGIRLAARIIDTIFTTVLAFFTGLALGILLTFMTRLGLFPHDWHHQTRGFSLIMFSFALVASFAYHIICEGAHGATLGKLCCGICVVRENGEPSNIKGAFIRTVAYLFDGLFLGMVAYTAMKKSPLNQRYGDMWGKTAVIQNDEIAPESKRTTGCLLLALGFGIAFYAFFVATGLLLKIWEAAA